MSTPKEVIARRIRLAAKDLATLESLRQFHPAQLKRSQQLFDILTDWLRSPEISDAETNRLVDCVVAISGRFHGLERSLQGGSLSAWSQMIDTQNELECIEMEFLKVLKCDDHTAERAHRDRCLVMICDLKTQCQSFSDALQDIWNTGRRPPLSRVFSRFHARQTGLARLWELLAPVDHTSAPVNYDPDAHDDSLYVVMGSAIETLSRNFTLSGNQRLDGLREHWAETMNEFENLILQHIQQHSQQTDDSTQSQGQNHIPAPMLLVRKLAGRGFVQVIVPGPQAAIGDLLRGYTARNRGGRDYVKFYDLPSNNNIPGEVQMYDPLLRLDSVNGKPALILVDEGVEFFLAVVENRRDGVALAYNKRHIGNMVSDKHNPACEPTVYHRLDQDRVNDVSERYGWQFKDHFHSYRHQLDIICACSLPPPPPTL